MHAAGSPAKNLVPRMPLGPSVTRMDGMLCSGTAWVCQKSVPGGFFLVYDIQCRSVNVDGVTGQKCNLVMLFQFGQYGINVKGHGGRCILDDHNVEGIFTVYSSEASI